MKCTHDPPHGAIPIIEILRRITSQAAAEGELDKLCDEYFTCCNSISDTEFNRAVARKYFRGLLVKACIAIPEKEDYL